MTPITLPGDVAESIGNFLGVPTVLFPILGLAVPAIWIVVRTRSFHLFRMKVWRLFHGHGVLKDEDLLQLEQRLDGLQFFRMATGINARTSANAKRILNWSEERNENPMDIGACGAAFDTESCELVDSRIAGVAASVAAVLFSSVLLALAAVSLTLIVAPTLIYKTNATNVWFSLSTERAKPFGGSTAIDAKTCTADDGKAAIEWGFNAGEAHSVCELLLNPDDRHWFDKELASQRHTSIWLLLFFGSYGWIAGVYSRSTFVARGMRDRLDKRSRHDNGLST